VSDVLQEVQDEDGPEEAHGTQRRVQRSQEACPDLPEGRLAAVLQVHTALQESRTAPQTHANAQEPATQKEGRPARSHQASDVHKPNQDGVLLSRKDCQWQ